MGVSFEVRKPQEVSLPADLAELLESALNDLGFDVEIDSTIWDGVNMTIKSVPDSVRRTEYAGPFPTSNVGFEIDFNLEAADDEPCISIMSRGNDDMGMAYICAAALARICTGAIIDGQGEGVDLDGTDALNEVKNMLKNASWGRWGLAFS